MTATTLSRPTRHQQLQKLRRLLMLIEICNAQYRAASSSRIRAAHDLQRTVMMQRALMIAETLYDCPFYTLYDIQRVVAADLRLN